MPLLRQQHPSAPGAPNLCLADFIRPRSLQVSGAETKTEKMLQQDIARRLGVFCCTVDASILDAYRNHEYLGMMAQLLCDRLAEATAELLTALPPIQEEVLLPYPPIWQNGQDDNGH